MGAATDLAAVHDVTRTVYEFAYGIDTRDWRRYRAIFTDEVDFDYSSYHGRPATTMRADDWVATVRLLFDGLDATQHSMSNPIVDLDPDGDGARCRVYMQAAHFLDDGRGDEPEFTIGGYYDDHLVRTDDGWRIDAVTLTVWWRRGNDDIMRRARERTR
jgi:hypothetical protein